MDDATRQQLSDINRTFYSTVAAEFDRSRAQPWAGWQPLLPHLAALPPEPRVLDIGCGNGRFGHFLTQHLGAMRYTGVDYSPEMLQITRKRLPDAQLLARDLVSEAPPAGPFDLVVCFGFLHHIPGAAQRLELVRALADRPSPPGGLLTFVTWRFADFRALSASVSSPGRRNWLTWWSRHDYLLDWRRGALRPALLPPLRQPPNIRRW